MHYLKKSIKTALYTHYCRFFAHYPLHYLIIGHMRHAVGVFNAGLNACYTPLKRHILQIMHVCGVFMGMIRYKMQLPELYLIKWCIYTGLCCIFHQKMGF